MGLFGKPKPLKQLDYQLLVARGSFQVWPTLAQPNRERVLTLAPRAVQEAARAAARAGYAAEAREALQRAKTAPLPEIAAEWEELITSSIAATGNQ